MNHPETSLFSKLFNLCGEYCYDLMFSGLLILSLFLSNVIYNNFSDADIDLMNKNTFIWAIFIIINFPFRPKLPSKSLRDLRPFHIFFFIILPLAYPFIRTIFFHQRILILLCLTSATMSFFFQRIAHIMHDN